MLFKHVNKVPFFVEAEEYHLNFQIIMSCIELNFKLLHYQKSAQFEEKT